MKLAIVLLCLDSVTNAAKIDQVSPDNQNHGFVEAQAGLLGAALSVGVLNKARETYLIKTKFDANLQGALGTAGLHCRKVHSGSHYFEPGVGIFDLVMDESESLGASEGAYASIAFGWIISEEHQRLQIGVEWTTVSILFRRDSDTAPLYATPPKFTLGTKF